jgi:thiol-disulfide isomerase/thioredoxin
VKRAWQITLAAAVLLAAGAGGFFSYRWLMAPRGAAPGSTVGTVQPSQSYADQQPSFEQPPPPAPSRAVPEVLPDVAVPDASGKARRLSEWKGRLLAVNFWATWCEPCQREIPLLKRLRRERAAEGLEVVGIAVDLRAAVAKYAHDARIDYPVLMGERDGLAAITALGMDTVFPFTVFADRSGRIIALKVGELRPEEAKLILDRMHALDERRLSLPEARTQIADGLAALAARQAAR